jgi:hypothetical protein
MPVLLDVSPEAAGGGMAGALGLLIVFVVKVGTYWHERRVKRDMAAADKPVAPMPPPTAQLPAEWQLRVAKLEGALSKWGEDELRAELRRSQHAAREARADAEAAQQQLIGKTYALEIAIKRAEAAERREQALAKEHAELKRQLASTHSTTLRDGIVTPLRPGPRGD